MPELPTEQTIETPVIWDAKMLIVSDVTVMFKSIV